MGVAAVEFHQGGLDDGASHHDGDGDIEASVFPVADVLVLPVPLLPVSSNLLRIVKISFTHIGWGVAVVPAVKKRPAQLVFQVLKILA